MRKLLTGLCAALIATASVPALSQTPTTNFGWLKPTIGASANTWGSNLNGDLDGIDSTVFGIQTTANGAMPKSGGAFTGKVNWAASVAAAASANCPNGTAPSPPTTGDLWCVGNHVFYYDGSTAHTLAYLDSSITGNAATASAWASARTETLSGAVTGSASVNGAGNWTIATSLGAGVVTGGNIASGTITPTQVGGGTYDINITGSAANATNATVAASANSFPAQTGFGGGASGNAYLPSFGTSGTSLNWGTLTVGANSSVFVSYQRAYNFGASVSLTAETSLALANPLVLTSSNNGGFTVRNQAGEAIICNWQSIGN